MTDILFAEDDAQIREWVTYALERGRYSVRAVSDGAAALLAYAEKRPDVAILDVMMPKVSGYEVLLKIRERDAALPVMLLTAKSTESDKVLGLDIGADDYMTKPFGVRELLARIAALLRRAKASAPSVPKDDAFAFAGARVSEVRHSLVTRDGEETPLTEHELGILRLLAAHPDQPVSRDAILNAVWGVTYGGTNRTLDNTILALRKKLGRDAAHIETVYATGYRYLSK